MRIKLKAYLLMLFPTIALVALISGCNDESGNKSTTTPATTDADTAASASTLPPSTTTDTGTVTTSVRTKRKGKVTLPAIADANANAKMEADKQGYYNRTEVLPTYNGGQNALENYITNNIEYPQDAIDNNMEGTVTVQFAVDEQGTISNVKTIGNKLGHGLEEEAVRVISKMPKWTPGQIKGKNVKTWRTLPINYKLES